MAQDNDFLTVMGAQTIVDYWDRHREFHPLDHGVITGTLCYGMALSLEQE